MAKLFILTILLSSTLVRSKVEKIRIPDEDGGVDWILEVDDDLVKSQYRDGEIPIKVRSNQKGQPWPQGVVPYVINNAYNGEEKQKIIDGLDSIGRQMNNCVRFVPRWNEKDYVHIMATGKGCNSMVGKLEQGGQQILSLDHNCLSRHAIVHEASHALGFDHTQCRSDRDRFLDIFMNNVQPGMEHNFNKKDTNNELVGFDYYSVLIYPPKAFSKNGQPTMQTKDPKNTRLLRDDERPQLSKLDIQMIRRLYKCR